MSRTKGILFTILAASSFGLIPLFAKIAYANGFNPYTFTLYRSLFASIEIFIFIKIKNIKYRVEKEQYITLFKVSLVGYSLMMLTLSISYNYMSTGLATTIHFIYPVIVMLASIIFYKEKTIDWLVICYCKRPSHVLYALFSICKAVISLFGSMVSIHCAAFHGYRTLRRRL